MAAQSLRFSLSIFSPTPTQLPSKRITPKPYRHLAKPFKVSPIHSEISASSIAPLVSNGASVQGTSPSFLKPIIGELELGPAIEVDRVVESELKESGFRSTRKTKIVCTIGPATCGFDELEALAVGGMNVARLNMCHGTHDWHRSVIEKLRRLNEEKGFVVAIMMDTQGSEIHMGDLAGSSSAKVEDGDVWTFSMRSFDSELPERTVSVNYDGFAEDVYIGDELIVDGGMARFEVIQKIGPDVKCLCTDPGLLLPRANLTFWRNGRLVQERNAMLPTISAKDWLDIDFGISEGVDFIAVSFVKSAEVINHLKRYLAAHSHDSVTSVISKIENVDSLKNLDTIIQASDGVMVARGDLGAQIPLEQVPSVQKKIVEMCRELNKPVIVASQLLESMIEYPIPTRAEVADVTEVVRQQADALMLSGESAMGLYPFKALSVLRSISLRIEKWWREDKYHEPRKLSLAAFTSRNFITNELCTAAASMANKLGADALFVYTKSGHMASLLSQCRPDCPIFAFTPSVSVRRRMNLQWGLVPFCLHFSEDDDSTINKTFAFLKARGMIKPGDTIISVSDTLQSIQVVNVPHRDGRESPLLRAPRMEGSISLINPSTLFPLLAVLGFGDAASGIIDPSLPKLFSIAAVSSLAIGVTLNSVLLPQLSRIPQRTVDVIAIRQQLLAQYDVLESRIKDLKEAAENEVWMLARMYQLENKIFAVGEPSYSARRSRVKRVREGLKSSLRSRIEVIESYAKK